MLQPGSTPGGRGISRQNTPANKVNRRESEFSHQPDQPSEDSEGMPGPGVVHATVSNCQTRISTEKSLARERVQRVEIEHCQEINSLEMRVQRRRTANFCAKRQVSAQQLGNRDLLAAHVI